MVEKLKPQIRLIARNQPETKAALRIVKELGFPQDVCAFDIRDMWSNAHSKPTFLVAIIDDVIVGIIAYVDARLNLGTFNMLWVMVRKDLQRRGIGTALVTKAIEDVRALDGANRIQLTTMQVEFFWKFNFQVNEELPDKEYQMSLKL